VIHLLIQDPPPEKLPPPWEGVPVTDVDEFGQLPVLASSFDHVDGLFYFTYVVCIVFFVLITGVLLYSVVAHRRKTWDQPPLSNVTHNTPLEVVWTVIPLIIVMVMFAWGFKGSLDMMTVPSDAVVA
jgi:cytochrome c oxidase subunit 2